MLFRSVWHTTGSGKTLTSFKASTLLKDNPNTHKCVFVVDRKDLDRQTLEESIQKAAKKHNEFLKELGLPLLPGLDPIR